MKCATALLCVAAFSGAALAVSAAQSRTGNDNVGKVITLLNDLKARIEVDHDTEKRAYDRYACWCERTTKRKADAIEQAQEDIRSLGQSMLKLKFKVSDLMATIKQLENDIKDNQDEQSMATSLRTKQNSEYMAESMEMKQAINALERAVIVLSNATEGSSFLQQGSRAGSAVRLVLDATSTSTHLSQNQVSLLSSLSSLGGTSRYAPQSATVQGMLRDLYDTFSINLEGATNTEAKRNRDFEGLIADKVKELANLRKEKAKTEEEKAEAENALAETTQSYDDTMAQKKADIAFFDETKVACESKHSEWVTRSEMRQEELDGIIKALNILSDEDARDLFIKAIKPGKETGADSTIETGAPSLLQVSAENPENKAYSSLKAAATKARSLRLAALAVKVREAKVGHFHEVMEAVDDMMKTLKDEEASDIAKRDQCKEEYKKTNSTIANIRWLVKKNQAKIDKLDGQIEKLKEAEAKTIQDIQDVEDQISDMTKERKAEHEAHKVAKKEDQDVVTLLTEARDALSSFYKKNSVEMGSMQGSRKVVQLTQDEPEFEVSADQAPEAEFSDKGARVNESKGILQLLAMLIEDVSDEIRNGVKAEIAAQLEFDKQKEAAEKLKEQLEEKKVNIEDTIAKREDEKKNEKEDMDDNNKDLKDEVEYRTSITADCDWIIKAFGTRREHRAAEMNGLRTAKEFLAGAKPAVLLEGRHGSKFDDAALAKIGFLGIKK